METGFGDEINRQLALAAPDEQESESILLFLITRIDSVGGAQNHVLEMCRAAVALGWQVHLAYGTGEGDLRDVRLDGVEIHRVEHLEPSRSPFQISKAVKSLRKLLRILEPDLVSTHQSTAGVVGRISCIREKVCNIHTAHAWSAFHTGPWWERVFRRILESVLLRFAHGIVCLSEWDKLFATSKLRLKDSNIKVVYQGCIDPLEKGYEVSLMLGIRPIRIAFVGRHEWPKQQDAMLRYVRYRGGDVEVDFVGEGPDLEKNEILAEGMGIGGLVRFHEQVDDVNSILAQCQYFALVSDWEGFPLSVIEAMAMGLPAVVSNVGGTAEAVDNGVTGILVSRGKEEALFEALDLLLNDFEKRFEFARNARKRYVRHFRVGKMTASALSFYESILAAHNS